MVILQKYINSLTKSNIENEEIITNILEMCLVQKNKMNMNTNIDKYNNDINYDIDRETISKILNSDNIIKYILTNYNFKNLTYNILNYKYINYILNSIDINSKAINSKDVLLLSSLYGEFNSIFKLPDLNIDIYDLFEENIKMSQLDYDINHSKPFKYKHQDYLHKNIINKNYDLILCNFPQGLKNIIHAECCDKIKQLKIRGTKSEPLILQLIMMSLKRDGKAVLMVPNTLLNNDSVQHVKTRELLIKNFNVTRIINLDNTSILYFENTGITKKIIFEQFNIENEDSAKIFEIEYANIVQKNYNLYYEKYLTITMNIKKELCNYKLNDIIDIIEYKDNMEINQEKVIIPMYYDNNQKITIQKEHKQNDCYTIKVKHNDILEKYIVYYFYYVIGPTISSYTKGKLKKLDINNLLETDFQLPPINIQNYIIEYYDKLNNQITNHNQTINKLEDLKKIYLDIVTDNAEFIKLKEICSIDNMPDDTTKYCIQRNSKTAGAVFNYDIKDANNNNVYFINNIKNYIPECLYIILKHNESKLNKFSCITNTINLSKNCLENLEIKNVPLDIQTNIINKFNIYESLINETKYKFNLLVDENLFKCLCVFK